MIINYHNYLHYAWQEKKTGPDCLWQVNFALEHWPGGQMKLALVSNIVSLNENVRLIKLMMISSQKHFQNLSLQNLRLVNH